VRYAPGDFEPGTGAVGGCLHRALQARVGNRYLHVVPCGNRRCLVVGEFLPKGVSQGGHALRADEYVLRIALTILHGDEAAREGRPAVDAVLQPRSGPVHPHRLAAEMLLHRAVAVGVVPVERHVAVLRDAPYAVLPIPQQFTSRNVVGRVVAKAIHNKKN